MVNSDGHNHSRKSYRDILPGYTVKSLQIEEASNPTWSIAVKLKLGQTMKWHKGVV